ncbi:MAG: hypothetical protein GX131_07005 [candidate division WS1 bacterium]|jgi:hypothetical protein|nr:hypothetical protein [candidate division WS1 bacterium]
MSLSSRSVIFTLALLAMPALGSAQTMNLLLNPRFDFHSFANHRHGRPVSYESQNVAYWNTDAWGDITVMRESHAPAEVRPDFSTGNLVRIEPGKRLWQFMTLAETGLTPGDIVSLSVRGFQPQAGALRARIMLIKLDSEDGEWSPAEFGLADQRTFPRHSRGEPVVAQTWEATPDAQGLCELRIEGAEIIGHFTVGEESHSGDVNTIGLQVELANTLEAAEGEDRRVWACAPALTTDAPAAPGIRPEREMEPLYRHIPRTIQKLWKGEPIHVLLMGSSIDRGSANPPMYLYDEDPQSPTFKQPLADGDFNAELVGRPELDGYFGWWRHYFSYTGRLKLELMRKFDLGPDKLLFNWMACDGSCVGEAHSGLADYASLSLPPEPNTNGHALGRTWEELYPELMSRPEGPGPDLVIFGSGANEKTDTPHEAAVIEGMIRWIQRHYPGCEFLFGQFQNQGGYTPNPGDLQALALRYGIPFTDYGLIGDQLTRWVNFRALVPRDGHPQASAHFLWFKQLERAFETWDPIAAGQPQEFLPERMHPNTYGWEGEMRLFDAESPRIVGSRFILEDTAFNAFARVEGDDAPVPVVDGIELSGARRSTPNYDRRNSWFRHGNLALGDRHILEVKGPNPVLTYVDSKVCPNRQLIGIESPRWELGGAEVTAFASEWGAPFGERQAVLQPGTTFTLDVVATDISVAYVDAAAAGTLRVLVDGEERLAQAANVAFTDTDGAERYLENRRGILGLRYGLHRVTLEAVDAPVAVLGVFTYDARSNRNAERRLTGMAAPGETVAITPALRARPLVICTGGLAARYEDTLPHCVTFTGTGSGTYEIVGE